MHNVQGLSNFDLLIAPDSQAASSSLSGWNSNGISEASSYGYQAGYRTYEVPLDQVQRIKVDLRSRP